MHQRCKCRCGGKLHGANRVLCVSELSSLKPGDPHRPESLSKLALVAKLRRVYKAAAAAAELDDDVLFLGPLLSDLWSERNQLIAEVKRG